VVNAVAFEAAVAQDLSGLHACEGVLDAGADLAVGGVVLIFSIWEFGLAALAAVRDDQAGAPVAVVRDDGGAADCSFRTGQLPCFAVVAVAGQWLANGDDQASACVDDDLVVGRVPVVLRLGAAHYEHSVLAKQFAGLEYGQPGKGGYPGRLRHRDHTSRGQIISPATSSSGTALSELPTYSLS